MPDSIRPTVNFNIIPVIELRKPNGEGEVIKIYADGRLEGGEALGYTIIINRMPLYIAALKE